MTIDELMPSITQLSQAEKIRLVQVIMQQLAQHAGGTQRDTGAPFDPAQFHGAAQLSRHEVDQYLASVREGWNT